MDIECVRVCVDIRLEVRVEFEWTLSVCMCVCVEVRVEFEWTLNVESGKHKL